MSILTWIILGLIVGFIANKLVNKTGEGVLMNIVLGSIGAVFGGELINKFGMAGATWLNMWSVLVSVGGAALFLVIYNALARRALKIDSLTAVGQGSSTMNQPENQEGDFK
jgi:uncharacterized membrane protein YeaQ/YmgE (transglycosylase-associated protein family)